MGVVLRVVVAVLAVLAVVLLVVGYTQNTNKWGAWIGFGRSTIGNDVQRAKKLWDWMQLLIVPAALAGAAIWFNHQQQMQAESTNRDQAQESLLNTYVDRMSALLLDPKNPLSQSHPGDPRRTVARARTLEVLSRLDGRRRGLLLRFLSEAHLITGAAYIRVTQTTCTFQPSTGKPPPRITQRLPIISLSNAVLSGADLSGVDLDWAAVSWASLNDTYAIGPQLSYADLHKTNLSRAHLRGAHLLRADLRCADLSGADLHGADLRGADLRCATLSGAPLQGTDLRGANLYMAERKTDNKMERMPDKEVEQEAANLAGATLPSGKTWPSGKSRTTFKCI